ncbi:site-specific integrase [Piscibacillus salipiscarius]|uniref:Tyrosine-type recombinase/integrase n=2 Tax=Piscibacillus salipiscarius TaxID=299480 RepID=A0ABW5QES6_9BACI
MPVYKDKNIKKKEKWYFEVELGLDENGKRKRYRERGFRTKKEAEEAMIKAKRNFMEGTYTDTKNLTYQELFNQWINTKKDISEATKELYLTYFRIHLNPGIGSYKLNKLSPFIIQRFINTLYDKNLSSSSVKRIYSVVRSSLQYAVRMQLLSTNFADSIEKPKENTMKEVKVWSTSEVKQFISSIEGASRYAIAYKLAVYTGMRQGEILGLRWKDINFEKSYLTVQQKLTHKGKIESGAKNKGSMRNISLNKYIIEELLKHKEIIELEKVDNQNHYQDNNLVVCTEIGTPCHPRNLLRLLYSHIEQSGVSRIKFHDLRHTHASLLLLADVNIKIISERLGHASIRITLDTYAHLLPNMQKEAIKKLDTLFGE